MTDHPLAVRAAIERARPNPTDVARYRDGFLRLADPCAYWCEIAVALHGVVAEVNDAHVNACTSDACRTCTAIGGAVAVYDAMDQAEAVRCTCRVRDHVTLDCPPALTVPEEAHVTSHNNVYGFLARVLVGTGDPVDADPATRAAFYDQRARMQDELADEATEPTVIEAGRALADEARVRARQLRRGDT